MIRDRFGETVSDEWHYPKYTEGCWGKPGRSKCHVCKFRAPVKLLQLIIRIRRGN